MGELRVRTALTVCASIVLVLPLTGQQASPRVEAIPSVERFAPRPGLRVRLTVAKPSVAAFEDPGFTVHLDNVSDNTMYLNPVVFSSLYVYGNDGKLIEPVVTVTAEAPLRILTRESLKPLSPGETFEHPVPPLYFLRHDASQFKSYTTGSGTGERLMLRAGAYTARVVYVQAPGFPVEYRPRDVPEVWEGLVESEPVAFTVGAGAETLLDKQDAEVRAARQAGSSWPPTVEEAERDLTSDDRRTFTNAVDMLVRSHSTSSAAALRMRLTDPAAWRRTGAARALLLLGDERARDVAISQIDSDDAELRSLARDWLATRCTTAGLPWLEKRLALDSDPGATALGRCGTAAAFTRLRPLLEWNSRRALSALFMLTFEGSEGSEVTWRATPADWDRWYARHKSESRREWAERQLRENGPGAFAAADYLRRTDDRRVLPALRRATASPSVSARIAAARGIAQFDRREGIALLKRELEHRDPRRCAEALQSLNELTDRYDAFDFYVPAERRRAMEAYAAIVQ